MRIAERSGPALAAIGLAVWLAPGAWAADWKVASGDFDSAANWTGAYYGAGVEDWVRNGGTAYVTTDMSSRQPRFVWVHAGSTVAVQNGGTLAPYEGFYLGRDAGTGTVIVESGGRVQGGAVILGYNAGTGNQIVTLKGGGLISASTFVGDTGQGQLNVQGGTLHAPGAGNFAVGRWSTSNGLVIQDGGSVSCGRAAFVGLAGSGEYRLNGGTFSPSATDWRVFAIGGSHDGDRWGVTGGNGTFIQTGGTFSPGGYTTIGDYLGTGLYRVSGGTFASSKLTIGSDTGGTGTQYGAGTLEIDGSGAVSVGVNGELKLGPGASLTCKVDGGGVDAVSVLASQNVTLDGTLRVSVRNGIACMTSTSHALMTYGSGKATGDFATKSTSLFTTAKGATQYTAALDSAKDVLGGGLLTIAAPQTFAAQNLGWLAIKSDDLAQGLFKLYLATSASGAGLDALVASINSAGYLATTASLGAYNLQVNLPTPTAGNRAYFAYDFATAGVNVSAAQLPEPAALFLLTLGALGFLRRRR